MSSQEKLIELAKLVRYDILTSTTTAASGHPTSSLSGVELMTALFFGGHLKYDLQAPDNLYNDRVIFSKGHAAPLLYALYHAAGHFSKEQILSLRKIDSDLEGHPTPRLKVVDVATGSLGQGLSIASGMALGMKQNVKKSKTKIDREPKVFVLLGDSEFAEGQIWEALELSSHYKLNNVIGILDVNRLGECGETMLGWDVEKYAQRVAAFGWETIVIDGHNFDEVTKAYETAFEKQKTGEKPVMIVAKTVKGKGVSFLENQNNWHGKPVPQDKLEAALKELGEIDTNVRGTIEKPQTQLFTTEQKAATTPVPYTKDQKFATREAYGDALATLGTDHPELVVLDAEVSNSTYSERFKVFPDRFYEMYIAEQNMVSSAVGLSKMGFIPFSSSFAAFLSRAFDQMRMAQYSEANVKIVGSHAGVSIGPDGSSQMALEDLAMTRSILESVVLYPSDPVAAFALTKVLLQHKGFAYMRTTRAKTPVIYDADETFEIGGSKVLFESENDRAVIVTAGITLHEAIKAHQNLLKENISVAVVDAYSVKPLDEKTIIRLAKKTGKVIVVEDHYPYGGLGEAVKTALSGLAIEVTHLAVNKIPRSGSPEELLAWAGIDAEAIVKSIK